MRNLLERFAQNVQRFMYGRYGVDPLNTALLYSTLALSIVGMFWHSIVIYWLSYAMLFWMMFRALSRNYAKRSVENEMYVRMKQPCVRTMHKIKHQMKDKTSRYFNCPQCHQTIRVPKGKGKIAITCPKCRKEFVKRT